MLLVSAGLHSYHSAYLVPVQRQCPSLAGRSRPGLSPPLGLGGRGGGAGLDIRGGGSGRAPAVKAVAEKKADSKVVEALNRVLPGTRLYLLVVIFCTAVHLAGLPAPDWFALGASGFRWLQVWRYFTSMAYLGAPSMSMASSIYFLINYGQSLERESGSTAYAWFMLVQTVILSLFGLVLGFPFQAKAFITSVVYSSSRRNSFEVM
jgi:hypothetical protein